MIKQEIKDIHPLTIINDRYGGCYSGGKFLAFKLEPWDVPKGVDGGDIECATFWDEDAKEYAIGKGDTIHEAINDLASKLQPAENAFNMDRYLFLDFDGVLNTGRYAKLMKNEGIDPFDEYGAVFDSEAKALEINAWLHQNAKKDYRYVILDDEDFFFPKQQEHLVLTDEYEGLTERKAQQTIWILNQ